MSLSADDGKRRARRGAQEPDDTRPFEEQLEELDAIVAALEEGKLPLDEALALYEKGVRLAQASQRRLDAASLRVSALRVTSGSAERDEGSSDGTFVLEQLHIEGA